MPTATAPTPSDYNRTDRALNRRAAWMWGSFVVMFLAAQIVIGVFAVVLATGDPSFAVVPDYHEKAIHWDESVKLQEESNRLGWQAVIVTSTSADNLGARTLVVTLVDRHGHAISDASVRVRAFHHARAGDPVEGTLLSHHDGHYTSAVPMRRNGLWQIEITATRGGDEQFLLSRTVDTKGTDS